MSSSTNFLIFIILIVISCIDGVTTTKIDPDETATSIFDSNPDLELPPASSNKEIVIYKPNPQVQDVIEEISTNDLPDENTFELRRKFSKFIEQFANNNCRRTAKKTNLALVLKNVDDNAPDNTQNQLLKMVPELKLDLNVQSSLAKVLSNKQMLKSFVCNNDQSVDFSKLFKPIQFHEQNPNVLLAPTTATTPRTNTIDPDIFEMLDPIFHKNLSTNDEKIVTKENNFNETEPLLLFDDVPLLTNLFEENEPAVETAETLETFQQKIINDIDDINQRFDHFISSSDGLLFMMYQRHTDAFSTCCQMNKKPNEHLLKKYVDAYDSLENQDTIIKQCFEELFNSDKLRCKDNLEKWRRSEELFLKFVNMYLNMNVLTDEDLSKWLETKSPQTIDVKNIVYNYHMATAKFCEPAIILLWEPTKLVQCETKYRSLFLNNLQDQEEYDKFNKEISEPFQQKAINLMTPANNEWLKLRHLVQTNIQKAAENKPAPKELIELNLQSIRDTLKIYQSHLQHPMVAHQAKRAHVYKVCCEPIETDAMLNQYLGNFNIESKQGHAMDKFLTNCVRQQLPQDIDGSKVDNECTSAYNDLTDAMSHRQNFINKYGKQNPDMIRQFRHATQLKKHQLSILRNMNNYVKKYCPEQHLFELMFDENKNIICESLIHHGVGNENFQNYSDYTTEISRPFQNLVEEDWIKLSEVIADLKREEPIGVTITHPKKPDLLIGLKSSASSMIKIVYQFIGISFILMMQMF